MVKTVGCDTHFIDLLKDALILLDQMLAHLCSYRDPHHDASYGYLAPVESIQLRHDPNPLMLTSNPRHVSIFTQQSRFQCQHPPVLDLSTDS
jgi:hypothetical protein